MWRPTALLRHLALISAILSICTAQDANSSIVTTSAPAESEETPTETVDFSSALVVAASVAPDLAFGNRSNPVPLPTDIPNYDTLSQLAARMPARPETVGEPDIEEVARIEERAPPRSVQKRQGTRRVLIVGDSMTHCNEGDFTWRYRISQWFASQNVNVDFVGPYVGTAQTDEPAPPAPPPLYGSTQSAGPLKVSGGYAASFDRSVLKTTTRLHADDL